MSPLPQDFVTSALETRILLQACDSWYTLRPSTHYYVFEQMLTDEEEERRQSGWKDEPCKAQNIGALNPKP